MDEGHNIRNPKTKVARAVVALNASRRWILTGTPIVRSPSYQSVLLIYSELLLDQFSSSKSGPETVTFFFFLVVDKFQKDLGSILTFLKICQPLDNEDFYKRLLLRPLKNGEAEGAELLRVIHRS